MSQIKVNRLTNANVYINGNSMLGKAEEIDLPKIASKMSEHKALGMVSAIELPSGFEKMEARIKWNSFYGDALDLMANPFATHSIQCRASMETFDTTGRNQQTPYVVFMKGTFKNLPAGNFKQNDNVEIDSNMAIQYMRMEINGVVKVEFDALANIYKVNGVDVLAQYKANIGG